MDLKGYAVQVAPKRLKQSLPSLILRCVDRDGSFGEIVVQEVDFIDFGDGTGVMQRGSKAYAFTQFGGDTKCYRRGSVVFDGGSSENT